MRLVVIFFLLLVCATCQTNERTSGWSLVDAGTIPDSLRKNVSPPDTMYDFHLIYSVAGLGTNMGEKMEYFEIKDSLFVFCMKQNSACEGQFDLKTDTLQTGFMRTSTRDSILQILAESDPVLVRRNLGISSGAFISLIVRYEGKSWTIQMHNAYDETGDRIVKILNPYIKGLRRLYVPEFPAVEYYEEETVKRFLEEKEKNGL